LNANLAEATELSRRAFVEVARPLPEPELRSAIGRALGLPGPFPNAPGWDHFELLAGNLDPSTGAVAWVEDRTRPHRTSRVHVECHTELRIARAGRALLTWPLEHYNPFFETRVFHLHIEEERATVVYREKHGLIAAVAPFSGSPRFVRLGWATPLLVLPDRLIFADESSEGWSVVAHSLPDLSPAGRRRLAGSFAHNEFTLDETLEDTARGRNRSLRVEGDALVIPITEDREERLSLRDLALTAGRAS
jgi:hypothetical protein